MMAGMLLYGVPVELFQPTADQKGVAVAVEVDDGLTAYADRNMINTVVRNLVNNAVKFTPRGGTVVVSGESRGDMISVTVADTGVGMDEAELSTLFSLQHRNSRAGTNGERGSGLGLILAHDYVKRNRGTLTARSSPGEGSRFTFLVPAAPSAAG